MNARSTRGPGGRGGRRPMHTGRGRRGSSSSGCAMVAVPVAAGLVLGVAMTLTPALALAGLVLYLLTSVLFGHHTDPAGVGQTRKGNTPAAVSAATFQGGVADGTHTPTPYGRVPASRPARRGTGRDVTPGGAA